MKLREAIVKWHKGKRTGAISAFARALGTEQPRISSWLSGRTWPNEDTQPKVCKLLGITLAELAEMRPQNPMMVRDAGVNYKTSLEARLEEIALQVRRLTEKVAEIERQRRPLPK